MKCGLMESETKVRDVRVGGLLRRRAVQETRGRHGLSATCLGRPVQHSQVGHSNPCPGSPVQHSQVGICPPCPGRPNQFNTPR